MAALASAATLGRAASSLAASSSQRGVAARSPLPSFAGLRASAVFGASSRLVFGARSAPAAAQKGREARRSFCVSSSMVSVGSTLPEADLTYFDKEGTLQTVSVSQLSKGKKVVLFAVPGAFTPTCSQKHLPGFIEKADELTSKGVDTIACVSVNDPFVMKAWGESIGVGEKVLLLADGSAIFTKALGVELDLTDKGLGIRSRRYALLADDGVVKSLNLEEGGAFTISGPDEILKVL